MTSTAVALTVSEPSLVMLSLFELPVSLLSATVGVSILLSTVKVMLAFLVFPAVFSQRRLAGGLVPGP